MYMPQEAMINIATKFTNDTGWPIPLTSTNFNEGYNMYSVAVKIDLKDPPPFYKIDVTPRSTYEGSPSRPATSTCLGTVQDVYKQDDQDAKMFQCIVVCSMSMGILTPLETYEEPDPTDIFTPSLHAKIKFTILRVDAYNVEHDFHPFGIGDSRFKSCGF